MVRYLLFLAILSISSVYGIVLKDSVISSGYHSTNTGSIRLEATTGQFSTDIIANTSNTIYGGFWQPLSETSSSGIMGIVALETTHFPSGDISDVAITVNGITVSPNNDGLYQFDLPPGIYSLSASLTGYHSVEISGIAVTPLTFTTINLVLVDWTSILPTQHNMLMLADVLNGTSELTGSNGNLLAAFGPGGDQDCRSIALWFPDLACYYLDVIGIVVGEDLTLKYVSQIDGHVYVCQETVEFYENIIVGSFENPFDLHIQPSNIPALYIQRSGDNIVLSWDGSQGIDYRVYYSDDPLSGFSLLGTTQGLTFIDTNAASIPKRFYRITYEY